MAVKLKKKPQPRTAKVPKIRAEAVQECPAFEHCREKKTDCGICLELDPEKWKAHVKAVMARQAAA
jgi:hypothetical protein